MKDDTRNNLIGGIIALIISIAILTFCAWACHKGINYPTNVTNGLETNLERQETPLILIEGNSIKANTSIFHIKSQVLGIMGFGLEIEEAELLNRIIECETGWRNVCNTEYGCNGGQGIAQLIPKTVKHCEEELGKEIDPFNERDALECACWLLKNEGPSHWGTPDSWWGSYWCWAN